MKLLSTSLLAAMAALGLTACDNPGPTAASPASAAAPANVQQGVGTSQEDRYVTQRQGSSRATQGGRITGIQQEGGGNVSVQRAPGGGVSNPRITGVTQSGSGDVSIQREGVGAPAAGSGETARSARRRAQQQQQAPAQ